MTGPIKAAIAILALLLIVLLGAWLVVGRTGLFAGSTRQTDPQGTPTPDPASGAAIPQLDGAAPAKAETAGAGTATFALG